MKNLPEEGEILEIGSCLGLSLNAITYYAQRYSRQNPIFSCDPWPFSPEPIANTNIGKHEYRSFIIESFKRNVAFFSREALPHSIEASGEDFFKKWRALEYVTDLFEREVKLGGSLAFCYIDGWHEYDEVRRDFDNCDEHLVADGFLLFDDSGDELGWEDVQRVVRDALETGRYSVVAKNPNYLLRKEN